MLNPRLLIYAALVAVLAFVLHFSYRAGKATERIASDAKELVRQKAAITETQINAKETQRRLERQKENQNAQDKELAVALADAANNHRDSDRLRIERDDIAQRWRDALRNTTAVSQCPAAGDAIGVLADVLGRADTRAGILASTADAARIAGLKCERDYDALNGTNK